MILLYWMACYIVFLACSTLDLSIELTRSHVIIRHLRTWETKQLLWTQFIFTAVELESFVG
jgi:hypothetical protein